MAAEEELLASLTDIKDASTPEILQLERICRHNAWIRRKTARTGMLYTCTAKDILSLLNERTSSTVQYSAKIRLHVPLCAKL
jgi:hypothetical protein